ncbi:MAG: DUF4147 domain-containing protein [Chloroflexi bacterium]|nr:DUF4147 domain-containing protein [Chloroflexota bacterium]
MRVSPGRQNLTSRFILNSAALASDARTAAALAIFEAGVAAAHPARLIPEAVRSEDCVLIVGPHRFPIPQRGLTVVGGGKASGAMAAAFEAAVGSERIRPGSVVATAAGDWPTEKIRQIVAGHPVPDKSGRTAARAIARAVTGLSADDTVVCLLSGGGTAMLTDPVAGVTLGDLRRLTRLLLASGAPISEINMVRRRLLRLAGGGLARQAAPAAVLTLAIRDVVNGPPEAIASGPTLPDPSSFADALAILTARNLTARVPHAAITYLEAGIRGEHPDTAKPGDPAFAHTVWLELADTRTALAGATAHARTRGISEVRVLAHDLAGEARDAARVLGAIIRHAASEAPAGGLALLWGGEFTVTLGRHYGEGGRSQEFAAALIPEIAGLPCAVVAAGTDGADFVPGIGGAVVTGATSEAVRQLELNVDAALRGHAGAALHRALGSLVEMAPTGTNVCDLGVCIIGSGEHTTPSV